ncbi:MAG TPA: response regulator transcription factor [Opitutus sp.]|nr:response regulator transcription factor [Opitutus sp.]
MQNNANDKSEDAKLGVYLVEDHPVTRMGLAVMLNREPDFKVCGESDNAAAALTGINGLKPAAVITDINLKTSNGLELIKNVLAMSPGLPILVISMYDEALYAERAIRAGASGYMMKAEAATKIVEGVRMVMRGEVYLSETIKRKLIGCMRHHRHQDSIRLPMDTLSDREMEVFELIGDGYTTREIAQRLNLSTKTIDSYREHLKIKLELANGAELMRRAIWWRRLENSPSVNPAPESVSSS